MTISDGDCEPRRSDWFAAGERPTTGMADDVSQPRLGWGLLAAALLEVAGALSPWVYINSLHIRLTGLDLGYFLLVIAALLATAFVLMLLTTG